MGKTITLSDDAYKLLVSLKQGNRDSFTRVVLRHIHEPATTNAELLEDAENRPPPGIDVGRLNRLLKERGRRSVGRK
jgi:predicted CopG family antitoxin